MSIFAIGDVGGFMRQQKTAQSPARLFLLKRST
jgi:hypothetical protein